MGQKRSHFTFWQLMMAITDSSYTVHAKKKLPDSLFMKLVAAVTYLSCNVRKLAGCSMIVVFSKSGQGESSGPTTK